jgi:hypothetical protein
MRNAVTGGFLSTEGESAMATSADRMRAHRERARWLVASHWRSARRSLLDSNHLHKMVDASGRPLYNCSEKA